MGKQRMVEERRATTDELDFDNDNSLEYDDPDLELSHLSLDDSMLRPFKGRRRASTGSSSSGSSAANCRTRHKSGHTSYADLITRAILSTAESRMTLSQIYDWMVEHVNGLQEQRSLHSSKGWKNAVRHTLSINPRFKRIQRQGRPGLWMLDSQSFAHRFPYNALPIPSPTNSAGSGDSAYLMHIGDGRFETENFILSPMGQEDPTGVAGDSTAMQTINVIHEDKSIGCIAFHSPIQIKEKHRSEASTQTEMPCWYFGSLTPHHVMFDYQYQKLQKPHARIQPKNEFPVTATNLHIDEKPPLVLESPQFVTTLPDDLRDINLDPMLNCNDVPGAHYWF